MNGSTLGFIVEFMVAGLLVVTIGYCVLVNRKLDSLRSGKSELRAAIRDLYAASGHAEQALANLRQSSSSIEETLGEQLVRAQKAQSRLEADIGRGEGLLSKLDVITHGGPVRGASRQAAPTASAGARITPADLAARREQASRLRHSEVGLGLLNAERGKSHAHDEDAKEVA